MHTRFTSVARLSRPLLAVAFAMAAPTAAWSQSATTASGTSVTTRVTPLPGEGTMADLPGMSGQYTTVSISAAGRTRTDVIDGSMEPVFSKGGYTLSDSTGMIVVQPASKTFFSISADVANRAQDIMQASGMTMKTTNVLIKLDTLGDGGMVDGHATQRYRVTGGYTLTIDMSGLGIDLSAMGGMAMPPIRNEMVTEYWIGQVAEVPKIALGPLSMDEEAKAGRVMPMSMMQEFTDKIAAVNAGLPAGLRLRTTARITMSGLPTGNSSSGTTTELSGIKPIDVELSQLVLPEGYTETLMPGMADLPDPPPLSKDGGARWRIKPGG